MSYETDEGEVFRRMHALWGELQFQVPPAYVWTGRPHEHAEHMRALGYVYQGSGEWIRWDDSRLFSGGERSPLASDPTP